MCVCLSVGVYKEIMVSVKSIWFSIKILRKVKLQQMHAHWGTTERIGSEHVFNGELVYTIYPYKSYLNVPFTV